jgi:hypothetical protein
MGHEKYLYAAKEKWNGTTWSKIPKIEHILT